MAKKRVHKIAPGLRRKKPIGRKITKVRTINPVAIGRSAGKAKKPNFREPIGRSTSGGKRYTKVHKRSGRIKVATSRSGKHTTASWPKWKDQKRDSHGRFT